MILRMIALGLALAMLADCPVYPQTLVCPPDGTTTEPDPTPPPSTGYVSPPLQSSGLAVKQFTWNGHKWNNDSGQTWNTNVPYAIQLGDGRVKFELHDTVNDRGQHDPSTKRRAEIGSLDKYLNGIVYAEGFDFQVDWKQTTPKMKQGHELMQVHWPSGASPPLAFRIVPLNGGAGFRVTTRGDGQGNINRYTGPLALGVPHRVDWRMQLGATGFVEVTLDGKQILHLTNIPIGTDKENGYSQRFGPYLSGMNGNAITVEVWNIAPFPNPE